MDYAFLTEDVEASEGADGEGESTKATGSMTIAVMQEGLCRSVWAYAVDSKGAKEEWLVEQVLEDLETIGLKNERIVLKSDQEPAIVEVMKAVQKGRESDYGSAMDNSRIGDSDSKGTIESAVKSVEGMVRTLKVALEERIGQKVQLSDPVMPWIIRHAGHLITRCWVRPSGKTAYQLIKGRRSNVRLIEFGEAVLFRIPNTKFMPGKVEPKWEDGVYIGFNIRTGVDLIATDQGVFKVSTVRRRPSGERWSKDLLDKVHGHACITRPQHAQPQDTNICQEVCQ